MATRPILYVLVGRHGGPQFSPTVFKTMLCLYHKGVEFDVKELVWTELRAKREPWKTDRPTLPTIELPGGEIVMDSNKIADWLESQRPDAPSLYLPDKPTSQCDTGAVSAIKAYLNYVSTTFGSPAPAGVKFSPFFAGICNGILGLIEAEEDRAYFTSDTKLMVQDGWKQLQAVDRDASIRQSKGFVVSLEGFLKSTPFFHGAAPGIIDYTIWGRYAFSRVADPEATRTIWTSSDTPNVVAWIDKLESKFASQLKEQKDRWPEAGK
ncbi:hypothetical protein JCM10212_005909 [Sporobolomyces blumeae]